MEDEAVLTYNIPMPSDGVTSESAPVLDFAQSTDFRMRLPRRVTVLGRRHHVRLIASPE